MITMPAVTGLALLVLFLIGVFGIGYGVGAERMLRKVSIRVIVIDRDDSDDDPDDGEEHPQEPTKLRVVAGRTR